MLDTCRTITLMMAEQAFTPVLRKGQGAQLAFLSRAELKHWCLRPRHLCTHDSPQQRHERDNWRQQHGKATPSKERSSMCPEQLQACLSPKHKRRGVVLGKRQEHPHNSPHQCPSHALTLYLTTSNRCVNPPRIYIIP